MKEKYLIGLANLVNGSMLGYEDNSKVKEYKKWIMDYVESLECEETVIRQNDNCVIQFKINN